MSSTAYAVFLTVVGDGAGADVDNSAQVYTKSVSGFSVSVQRGGGLVNDAVGVDILVMGDI